MSEQQPSSEAKAQELFDQGKLAFNKGEYESSVTKLGEACQLLQVSHSFKAQRASMSANTFNTGTSLTVT